MHTHTFTYSLSLGMTLLKQGSYGQPLDPCSSETSDCSRVGKCDMEGADVVWLSCAPVSGGHHSSACHLPRAGPRGLSTAHVVPVDQQPGLRS